MWLPGKSGSYSQIAVWFSTAASFVIWPITATLAMFTTCSRQLMRQEHQVCHTQNRTTYGNWFWSASQRLYPHLLWSDSMVAQLVLLLDMLSNVTVNNCMLYLNWKIYLHAISLPHNKCTGDANHTHGPEALTKGCHPKDKINKKPFSSPHPPFSLSLGLQPNWSHLHVNKQCSTQCRQQQRDRQCKVRNAAVLRKGSGVPTPTDIWSKPCASYLHMPSTLNLSSSPCWHIGICHHSFIPSHPQCLTSLPYHAIIPLIPISYPQTQLCSDVIKTC